MADVKASHVEEDLDLSEKYDNPLDKPETAYINSFTLLKERIKHHYEICSEYYLNLWGEHIHHGYFTSPDQTKEDAQIQLMNLLISQSQIPRGSSVLDIGCGIGGTARYLAKTLDCHVTGITISPTQVKIARDLTIKEASNLSPPTATTAHDTNDNCISFGKGSVRFIELDAENINQFDFSPTRPPHLTTNTPQKEPNPNNNTPTHLFDSIWLTESLSHLPQKPLLFNSTFPFLSHPSNTNSSSTLVIADWLKSPHLTPAQELADIKPIEDSMLLPPLCTAADYTSMAVSAGYEAVIEPMDISDKVARTWDLSWEIVRKGFGLWQVALREGRDGLAFLWGVRAMRRGFASGGFRYGVLVFKKP